MDKKKLGKQAVHLLNTKDGLHSLLGKKKIKLRKSITAVKYAEKLQEQQEELIKLQNWVIKNEKKIVLVFEGVDSAGKTGTIRRIIEHLNPRNFKSVALDKPKEHHKSQWFFQRYTNEMPKPGEMVFFDRSWYNRAVLEPVNKFCTIKEYETFMSQVLGFENMLTESGIQIIKFYFSITKKEQARRFKKIKNNPLKRWKMTSIDEKAQELWNEYRIYKNKMLKATSTSHAPWVVIDANKKTKARLKVISHILKVIPYKEQIN